VGRWISKHTTAYSWLPESTRVFPAPAELARRMTRLGFGPVDYELLMGGVCALYVATRTPHPEQREGSTRALQQTVDPSLRSG
jgi:ubiquinone/menaquinone biosynthesis C-methylase UbiE